MLWERGAYFWAIAASLCAAFAGVATIASAMSRPQPEEQACQVASVIYQNVAQCPKDSVVVHLGQRIGRWDGVSIEQD